MIAVKPAHHYSLLESAVRAIADSFTRSVRRYRAAQELRNIGANEVSAIARDLGITRSELRSLAKHGSGFPEKLKKMLLVLGIDGLVLQETDPILLRDMQKVCAFCRNTRRCGRELRAGSAAECFPDYCPNSANFDAARVTPTSRVASRLG